MAVSAPLVLVIVLSVTVALSPSVMAADAEVAISIANNPVISGGVLAIQCEILNFQQDNFKVSFFRVLDTGNEQITNGKNIEPEMGSNVFTASRAFPDGSVVYFLTILDVSATDEGRYLCQVFDVSRFRYISDDSIDIQIHSYLDDSYPRCTSVPSHPVTVSVDDTLKLKCAIAKGISTIETKWVNTKMQRIVQTRNRTIGNLVYSESSILVDSSLQNVIFSCEITSAIFSDWKRSCTVGPITVTSYMTHTGNVISPISGSQNYHSENIPDQLGICVECASEDMIQFHLTVAIVATSFLAIVFLVLSILLCYKYHQETPVIRKPTSKMLTPQQSVEPVYVSLQRRSVNADHDYMTLEDPHNPDNKIVVPRETFDEYCKTMRMKSI